MPSRVRLAVKRKSQFHVQWPSRWHGGAACVWRPRAGWALLRTCCPLRSSLVPTRPEPAHRLAEPGSYHSFLPGEALKTLCRRLASCSHSANVLPLVCELRGGRARAEGRGQIMRSPPVGKRGRELSSTLDTGGVGVNGPLRECAGARGPQAAERRPQGQGIVAECRLGDPPKEGG